MRQLLVEVAALSALTYLACLALGAPVPPPRPKAPPRAPVTAAEMAGCWEVGDQWAEGVAGGVRTGPAWYVTLAPDGRYWSTDSREQREANVFRWSGEWKVERGRLSIAERHVCAPAEQGFNTYTGALTRGKGGDVECGGGFMSGTWRRR